VQAKGGTGKALGVALTACQVRSAQVRLPPAQQVAAATARVAELEDTVDAPSRPG